MELFVLARHESGVVAMVADHLAGLGYEVQAIDPYDGSSGGLVAHTLGIRQRAQVDAGGYCVDHLAVDAHLDMSLRDLLARLAAPDDLVADMVAVALYEQLALRLGESCFLPLTCCLSLPDALSDAPHLSAVPSAQTCVELSRTPELFCAFQVILAD